MVEPGGVEQIEAEGEVKEFGLELGTIVGKPDYATHIEHVEQTSLEGDAHGFIAKTTSGAGITVIRDEYKTLDFGHGDTNTAVVIRKDSFTPPIEITLGGVKILAREIRFAETIDGSFELTYEDPSDNSKFVNLTGKEIYDATNGKLPEAVRIAKDISKRAQTSSEPISAVFSGIKLKIDPPKS